MGELPVNITPTLLSLLQVIPIWTFVGIAVKYWVDKSQKAAESFKKEIHDQFVEIQSDMKLAHHAFADSIQRIELKLADSGVNGLRENIEDLKESRTKQEMKLEAAFRYIDQLRMDIHK